MKVAVLIANGSEEIEALTPVDVLRRAGVTVDMVGVPCLTVEGSHGIEIKTNRSVAETNFDEYSAIIVPGGMPGATNISQNQKVIDGLKKAFERGALVASICASPAVVLADNGLIDGFKATCYPAPQFVKSLGDNYTGADVEIDRNLITANGPKSAFEFSLAVCDYLKIQPKF